MTAASKIDLFREHRDEYVMAKVPTEVRVGPARYLTVTGTGSPQSPEFQRKVGALYGCASRSSSHRRRRRAATSRSASSKDSGGSARAARSVLARLARTGGGSSSSAFPNS